MKKELIIIENKPSIPENWNYEESVKKVKNFVYKWKNLTTETICELYIARTILSKDGSHESKWSQYCKDIKSSRQAVDNWLNRFFPVKKLTGDSFTPELYNIWNFAKRNDNFGEKFFGQQTADLIMNLLYYYTEENDLVYDVFAGSGLTSQVCDYMKRRCVSTDIKPVKDFILKVDVTKNLLNMNPQLIFMDPPYWKQSLNKYTEEETDFGNMGLEEFYENLDTLFDRIDSNYRKFHIAFIIQNTQWVNNHVRGNYIKRVEPHGLKIYGIMSKYFEFEHHIIVPYSTQQYTPQMVNISKKEKIILQLHRDLLIFRKDEA